MDGQQAGNHGAVERRVGSVFSVACPLARVADIASTAHKYYEGLLRRQATLVCRLRTNASALNHHRTKFNDARSDLCVCGEAETRKHFLLNCSLYDKHRQHLISCLPNRILPSADDLLGNRALQPAILDFICSTRRFARLTNPATVDSKETGKNKRLGQPAA